MLDDIDQRLHLIELTSSDSESVQNKLDQCTVSYITAMWGLCCEKLNQSNANACVF